MSLERRWLAELGDSVRAEIPDAELTARLAADPELAATHAAIARWDERIRGALAGDETPPPADLEGRIRAALHRANGTTVVVAPERPPRPRRGLLTSLAGALALSLLLAGFWWMRPIVPKLTAAAFAEEARRAFVSLAQDQPRIQRLEPGEAWPIDIEQRRVAGCFDFPIQRHLATVWVLEARNRRGEMRRAIALEWPLDQIAEALPEQDDSGSPVLFAASGGSGFAVAFEEAADLDLFRPTPAVISWRPTRRPDLAAPADG
jgi:hypothetical protein